MTKLYTVKEMIQVTGLPYDTVRYRLEALKIKRHSVTGRKTYLYTQEALERVMTFKTASCSDSHCLININEDGTVTILMTGSSFELKKLITKPSHRVTKVKNQARLVSLYGINRGDCK